MKSMEVKPMLALPDELEVTGIEMSDEGITITAVSKQLRACCPLCGAGASRLHSCYTRTVADLPCSGQQVQVLVGVRRYFCDVPTCQRKIFAERLTPFVEPRTRVTQRVYQVVQIIGLATGGRLGVRVTDRLQIQTSRHTILRRILALPNEPVGEVPQIGIDDFSFRRGRKFGTIVVALHTHKVLDVLPDRTADPSAAWMSTHSEIELVSRDRGGDYAAAARKAVPEATQTADRFHLLKNLGEAVDGVLSRHLAAQRKRRTETVRVSPTPAKPIQESPNVLPKSVVCSQAKREERLAQYQQVVTLREQGFSQTAIASRREEGLCTVAQLHRELVADGYSHQYNSVYRRLARSFPEERKKRCTRSLPEGQKKQEAPDQLPRPPVLARQAMFLFLRRPEELEAEDQETLAWLRSLHAEVNLAYELVQQFAQMLRTRTGEQLDGWLSRVRASLIRELQGFVAGVIQDKAVVVAGLTLPQNNGLAEGKINKLKLMKRMGYGRAGFPLLRQRVLRAL